MKKLNEKTKIIGSVRKLKSPFPVGKGHSLVKKVEISKISDRKVIIGEPISEDNLQGKISTDCNEYRKSFCSNNSLKFDSENKIILEVRDLFRPTEDEGYCMLLTNKFRTENGLKPLKFLRSLANLVLGYVTSMANHNIRLEHDNFLERSCLVANIEAAAENIGCTFGFPNYVETLFRNWIKSTGHKENILGNYNAIGVTFVQNSKGEWFGCQFFARIANLEEVN